MIARAAVNKRDGREFNVDLDMCKNFIEQQIELIPPTESSKPDENVIYRYVSVVRNGIPRPIQVPVTYTYTSDHTTKRSSSREMDIKGTIGAEATSGGGAKGGKEGKKDGSPSAPTASANAKMQGTGKADVTAELKEKDSVASVDKDHEEHHYGERNVPGNADVVAPSGRRIYNLQLELRALKKARLEVYRKFDVGPEAGLGIGVGVAGGALGGAAIGAAAGIVVPVIGNIVGGVVGGIAGAVVGGGAAGGIGVGAVGGRRALDTVKLTAEDIFKIDDSDTKETVTKGEYIHCIIKYPYEADFDTTKVNTN